MKTKANQSHMKKIKNTLFRTKIRASIAVLSVVLVGVGTLLFTQAAPEHNVKFVVFCSTDSCVVGEGDLAAPADYIPKWYQREVGRPYNVDPGVIKITGASTAAAYRSGPNADPIFNVLPNVADELRSRFSPTTKVTILLGFSAKAPNNECGLGYVGGNFSVFDPVPSNCRRSLYNGLAHELGHNFGLDHTDNGTLMDGDGGSARGADTSNLESNDLDDAQAQALRSSSDWFVAGTPPPSAPQTSTINGYKVDQNGDPNNVNASIAGVPIEYTCCTVAGNSSPQTKNPYGFNNLPRGAHQISINKNTIPSGWTPKYTLCWDDGSCPAKTATSMADEGSRYTIVLDTTNRAVAHLWFHFSQPAAPPPPAATPVTSYLPVVGQQETSPNRKGCLDVEGGERGSAVPDSTRVVLYDCANTKNQLWAFFSDKTLRSQDSGKCLDAYGADTTSNSVVINVYRCVEGAPNQKWLADTSRSSLCLVVNTNKCLDAAGRSNANATPIHTYDWQGGDNKNQRWIHGGSTGVTPPPPTTSFAPATVTPACSGTNSIATVSWNKDNGGGQYSVLMGYGQHSGGGWANYNIPNGTTSVQIPNSAAGSGSSLTYNKSDYWVALNYNRTGQQYYTDFTAKNCTTTDPTAPTTPGTPSLNGTATTTSIPLKWNPSSDNVGVSSYDITISGGTNRVTNVGNTTSYTVSSLSAGTSYTFTVKARDAAGNVSASSGSFTTSTSSNPTPPPNAPPAPTGTTITSTTTTQVNFRWTPPADASRVRNYVVFAQTDGWGPVGYGPIYGNTASIGNLTPGKTYTVWAVSEDSSNVRSAESPRVSATLPTSAPSDTTPPSAPGKPIASNLVYNGVTLTWGASSDSSGITKYTILRNSTVIGYSTTTSFRDTGVTASTTVTYKVFATDGANLNSGYSPTSDPVRVPAPTGTTDTAKPSVPSNFSATAVNASQINLNWSPSTDNVGVTGYDVWRNYVKIASNVGSTNFGDSGLTAGTKYIYYVVARDAAGNVELSLPAETITAPNPPTSLAVTGRSVSAGSNKSTVSLSWQSDGTGVSGFHIYRNNSHVGSTSANQKSFTDTGLAGNTSYSYYVRAYNSYGVLSASSSSVNTRTCYMNLGVFARCP